jgi:hypothetical protein
MLKLNVGFSRKVGEANYGSRGASVNLELELESMLVGEPAALHERIRALFRMARASVDEELGGHASGATANGQAHGANGHEGGSEGAARDGGQHSGHRSGSGNGWGRPGRRGASTSQVRAIHAIANRQQIDLTQQLQSRFGVDRPDDLSVSQASELIDALKSQTDDGGSQR